MESHEGFSVWRVWAASKGRAAEAHGYLAALSNLYPFFLTFFSDDQEAIQPHRVTQARMIEQQIKLSRNALGPDHLASKIADHWQPFFDVNTLPEELRRTH